MCSFCYIEYLEINAKVHGFIVGLIVVVALVFHNCAIVTRVMLLQCVLAAEWSGITHNFYLFVKINLCLVVKIIIGPF